MRVLTLYFFIFSIFQQSGSTRNSCVQIVQIVHPPHASWSSHLARRKVLKSVPCGSVNERNWDVSPVDGAPCAF